VEEGKKKENKIMKFKVGDKVKILPSAIEVGIHPIEFGKIGKIVKIDTSWGEVMVLMDKSSTINNFTYQRKWYTKLIHIKPISETGQLLFDFYKVKR